MNNIFTDKKEIYFTNDVIKRVSRKHDVNPVLVQRVLNHFFDYFKELILETDDIVYHMPYMGKMTITEKEALRAVEKFNKRAMSSETEEEKEMNYRYAKNFRIRAKKVRIELEKLSRAFGIRYDFKRKSLLRKYFSIKEVPVIQNKRYMRGMTLEETIDKQNEYAYKFYEKYGKEVE